MNSGSLGKVGGSSLVEVMIALFVLAVGLLGILAMQVQSVQLNQNAHLYSRAAILASDLAEAIQSSGIPKQAFVAFDSGSGLPAGSCEDGSACTPEELAQWSYGRWLSRVTESLPGGDGSVEVAAGQYQIIVSFQVADGVDASTDAIALDEQQVSLDIGS